MGADLYVSGDWTTPYWIRLPLPSWDASIPGGDETHRIWTGTYLIFEENYEPTPLGSVCPWDPSAYLTQERVASWQIGGTYQVDMTYARVPSRVYTGEMFGWSDPNEGRQGTTSVGFFIPNDPEEDGSNFDLVTSGYSTVDAAGGAHTLNFNTATGGSYDGGITGFTEGINVSVSLWATPSTLPSAVFADKSFMQQKPASGTVMSIIGNRITVRFDKAYRLKGGAVYRIAVTTFVNQRLSRAYNSLLIKDWYLPGVTILPGGTDPIASVMDIPLHQGFDPKAYDLPNGSFDRVGYYNFLLDPSEPKKYVVIEPSTLSLYQNIMWCRTTRAIRPRNDTGSISDLPDSFTELP